MGPGAYRVEVSTGFDTNLKMRVTLVQLDDPSADNGPTVFSRENDAYASTPVVHTGSASSASFYRVLIESIGQTASNAREGYAFPAYGSLVSLPMVG